MLVLVLALLPVAAPLRAQEIQEARTLTDRDEIARYVARFNAERKLPDRYRIVFRVERSDPANAAQRQWRIDEFVRDGERHYWRREVQGPAPQPATVNETLVMPGREGKAWAWETARLPELAQPRHWPRMPDTPTGNVRFSPDFASDVRLVINSRRALLSYREERPASDGGAVTRLLEFDLQAGVLREGRSIFHGRGNAEEHRWIETFDRAPALAADFFDQTKRRLEGQGLQATFGVTFLAQANRIALIAGALLPLVLAFVKFCRALDAPSPRRIAVVALGFVAGVPALLVLLSIATQGYLSMLALSIPWSFVGHLLPREVALPLAQFLAAAMVSAVLSALVFLALRRRLQP